MNHRHPGNDSNDYLWDRSDPVDLDVARLERLLAPHAWRGERRAHRVATPSPRRLRRRIALASAAMLAVIALGAGSWYRHRLQWPAAQPWQLVAVSGQVRVDGRVADAATLFAPGSELETGKDAEARLQVARIGQLVLGEGSRLDLVTTRGGHHRVRLRQGSLWAKVWAPPGSFGVHAPGTDVRDLGCEFVLRIDAQGNGTLIVQSGWVQIDGVQREILVPQGTRSALHAGRAPGTPYDLGARAEFVAALAEIDAQGRDGAADGAAVRRLLAASRPQDAITLLTLLGRYPQLATGPLFDRLVDVMPSEPAVTREALRARGSAALDPWWRHLPYPRVKRWWMQWPDAFAGDPPPRALLREAD